MQLESQRDTIEVESPCSYQISLRNCSASSAVSELVGTDKKSAILVYLSMVRYR